ncbi:murein biosynthesis integral membrane protein MurJ [soil metagenome]
MDRRQRHGNDDEDGADGVGPGAGTERNSDEVVLRPRTVTPGIADEPGPVVRPRTVEALGRPDPIAPSLEPAAERSGPPGPPGPVDLGDSADPAGSPPTGPVPVVTLAPSERADHELDDDLWVDDEPSESAGRAVVRRDAPAGAGLATNDGGDGAGAAPSRMLRDNLVVASGTAVSRLTGLIRTALVFVLLAPTLGDTYLNANNTPNMIYELILGGVLTATLVPLFTDDIVNRRRGDATSAIISFALVALAVVTVVAAVIAPLLILLLSSGAPEANRSDYLSVGIPLALLFAPQVFFYGLMAVGSAALRARHRFLAASWAPVLNNMLAIAALAAVWGMVDGEPTLTDALANRTLMWVLGLGTTLGIAVMALSLYPSIRRSGIDFRFNFDLQHPAVRRAVRLSAWTFGYVIANQVALVVIQILAEPSTGGTQEYQTAFQFFQLPHGLLAVSIMVTFEPLLGRADSRGDRRAFNDRLLLGFRLIGLLVIPAAVGYVALPNGLDYRTFLATGTLERVLGLTGVIGAFAVGLPGFSSYLYCLRAFYAMKNTKIPFVINCIENAINIVLAIVFVRIWGIVGLALAFALAYTIAAVIAVVVLNRHSPGFDWQGLLVTWTKLLGAAGVMGGVVFAIVALAAPSSPVMILPAVGAAIAVGGIVYLVTVYLLRVPGISELFHRLPGLSRFAPTTPSG